MNAGGRPQKATDDEIVATVADCYAAGDRLPGDGGVPVSTVADELEMALSTASRHLNRLADEGQLEQVYGLGPTGRQETYAPAEASDDE